MQLASHKARETPADPFEEQLRQLADQEKTVLTDLTKVVAAMDSLPTSPVALRRGTERQASSDLQLLQTAGIDVSRLEVESEKEPDTSLKVELKATKRKLQQLKRRRARIRWEQLVVSAVKKGWVSLKLSVVQFLAFVRRHLYEILLCLVLFLLTLDGEAAGEK